MTSKGLTPAENAIRTDASPIRGGIKTPVDQRPYLDALCDTFPGLRSLLAGNWAGPEQSALLTLGKTAIAHGSAPMAAMFLLLCDRLGRSGWHTQCFEEEERSRLRFLCSLGNL